MIAFKYHFVIILITIMRVRSASIRREPARETVVDYVYEIRDDPIAPAEEEAEVVGPGEDYDWKKYQEQELIFAPGSADELRVRPDGAATFTQQEVKRYHRTTGNGDDYYVYEYWYPVEEDQTPGLGKVRVMNSNGRGRASGNLAEDPNKQDSIKLKETTTTTAQPERVKRAEEIGTTLAPKPGVAAGQQSGSPTTTIPSADAKLAVVVQSEKGTDSLNKQVASGSSSGQEKSTISSPIPITSPLPVEMVGNISPTEAVKKKKSVNVPAVIAERSSLDVTDASNNLLEKSDKGAESKNAKLVSKASPVEQINVAPAAAANGSTEKAAEGSSTTAQTVTDVLVPAASASEVERKNVAKRHEEVLTTSTEPSFEEAAEDMKTTTPKTIVVVRKSGNEVIAEVVPNASAGKQVGTTVPVNKVKFEFAPAQAPEEVTKAPSPPTTTSKETALAKTVMMAESQQSEITQPPTIPSIEKVAVASAAAVELPILRFGFPEISRREVIAMNQAEAQLPIVITKRETGKPPTNVMEAEVTLVDSEDVEEAPASNTVEAISTVAPAKQEEKEDSGEEQEEVDDPDQAPASKISNTAASHVEEDVAEGAPTDQDLKDSLSKLVKKQTSSHGKHFKGEEMEAEEDNMAPGNKAGEASGEEEEVETTTTVGTTPATVIKKQDSPEEEEDTTQVDAVTENDEEDDEEDEEAKENAKREDSNSEATQEMVDDGPKNMAEGLSLVKALVKRVDSAGGAGIEGGGIAEGGDLNQSDGSKSKVPMTDISPGKIVKATSDEAEDDDEDGESDDDDDDDDDKSESPGESTFPHHGKHSTGRKRRELSDKKFVREENFDKATFLNHILHRTKRSSDMREMEVDGQKVYVDTPLEFNAPGSNFDGIADGRHLLMNGVPRKTSQTGSGYDAFPQNVGSDKFPHPFCDLERDTGIICPGVRRGVFLEQFFYDSETNRCSHFVYNGCGGNANRFSTLWECNQFCGKQNIHTKRQD